MWAFGVTMIEIFDMGGIPYAGICRRMYSMLYPTWWNVRPGTDSGLSTLTFVEGPATPGAPMDGDSLLRAPLIG